METTSTKNQGSAKSDHRVLDVDLEALYDQLRETQAPSDALTTQELAALTGWSTKRVRGLIKKAMGAGLCRYEPKNMRTINNRDAPVSAYVFEIS